MNDLHDRRARHLTQLAKRGVTSTIVNLTLTGPGFPSCRVTGQRGPIGVYSSMLSAPLYRLGQSHWTWG